MPRVRRIASADESQGTSSNQLATWGATGRMAFARTTTLGLPMSESRSRNMLNTKTVTRTGIRVTTPVKTLRFRSMLFSGKLTFRFMFDGGRHPFV